MLNNLTNFFNLIVGRRIKTQLEPSDLIAIGTKQSPALGDYKPTAIQFKDLEAQLNIPQDAKLLNFTGPNTSIDFPVSGGGTMSSILIPANTIELGKPCNISIRARIWKFTTTGSGALRIYTNTTLSTIGANLLGSQNTSSSSQVYLQTERYYNFFEFIPADPLNSVLMCYSTTASVPTDNGAASVIDSVIFNPTVDNYIFMELTTVDDAYLLGFDVTLYK